MNPLLIVGALVGFLALRRRREAGLAVVSDAEIAPGVHRRIYANGCVRFWRVRGAAILELPPRPEWLAAVPLGRSCPADPSLADPVFSGMPGAPPREQARR